MKKIFFALCAVAALASCSNNEIVNLDQEAIAFDNAFVDNGTRAATDNFTIETDELLGFNVWATTQRPDQNGVAQPIVPILANEAVSRANASSPWGYATDKTQYWIPGNTYQFVAAKNYKDVTVVNGLPTAFTYDATSQADVLYAADTRVGMAAGANAPVAFTFDHLLSKAYFTVKVGAFENANYTYRVSNIVLNDVVNNATYAVAGGVWTPTAGSVYDLTFDHIAAAAKLGASTTNTSDLARLLVPATYTDLNVTCTVETLYSDDVIDVQNYNTNIAQEFVKGYVYNFILTLGAPGDAIKFTVTRVNEWIPTGNTNNETPLPAL